MEKSFRKLVQFWSIFHQRAATPAGEKIEKSGVMEKASGYRYICICILIFVFVFSTCMSASGRGKMRKIAL